MSEPLFLILSVSRTEQGPSCVWWRENGNGYTTNLAEAGRYTLAGVHYHADPPYHVAIPLSAIEIPKSKAKALVRAAIKHGVGKVTRFSNPKASHLAIDRGDTVPDVDDVKKTLDAAIDGLHGGGR